MTSEEVARYWLPAVRQVFGIYHVTVETCMELDTLLDTTDYHDFKMKDKWSDDELPEELKKLLVMLAGPHGKTILKMYRIRKGLE